MRMWNRYRSFIELIKPFYRHLLFLSLSSFFLTLIQLPTPLLTKAIIDQAFPQRDFHLALVLLLLILSINIFMGLINLMSSHYSMSIGLDLRNYFSLSFLDRLFAYDFSFFKDKQAGEILSRLMDTESAAESIKSILSSSLRNIMHLIIFPVVIFWLNWKLAIVGIISLPLDLYIVDYTRKKQERFAKDIAVARAKISAINTENFANINSIILSGLSQDRFDRTKNQFLIMKTLMIKRSFVIGLLMFLNTLTSFSVKFLFGAVGWYLIIEKSTLTLGSFIAVSTYLTYLQSPLKQLMNLFVRLADVKVKVLRFLEYYEYRNNFLTQNSNLGFIDVKEEISISNLKFSYNGDRDVFNGISFSIPANKITLVKGPSGIGKTTILYLLARHLEQDAGEILFDGVNSMAFREKSFRQKMGILTQEPLILNGSAQYNIVMSDSCKSLEHARRAATFSQVHSYIQSLPCGYRSNLNEHGENLSVGQKQRICLARLIAQNKTILLLDEPTAALDKHTEREVMESLLKLKSTTTIVIISHNEEVVPFADKVVTICNSKIADETEQIPEHIYYQ